MTCMAQLIPYAFPILLRAFFIVSFTSKSSGSILLIPLNLLALSSFGLSLAHRCFSFCWEFFDMFDHTSGQMYSGLDVTSFSLIFSWWSNTQYREIGCNQSIALVVSSHNKRSNNHQLCVPALRPM